MRVAPRLGKAAARSVLDVALLALSTRNLAIYPVTYANPKDVSLFECERGLELALIGTLPEFRSALESLYVFLVLKNGVPLAYGPASVFMGCCEIGINLFPEFRGGEIRRIYAAFMRMLHHVLGVRYFFLTRYGMGESNEEAIEAGSIFRTVDSGPSILQSSVRSRRAPISSGSTAIAGRRSRRARPESLPSSGRRVRGERSVPSRLCSASSPSSPAGRRRTRRVFRGFSGRRTPLQRYGPRAFSESTGRFNAPS